MKKSSQGRRRSTRSTASFERDLQTEPTSSSPVRPAEDSAISPRKYRMPNRLPLRDSDSGIVSSNSLDSAGNNPPSAISLRFSVVAAVYHDADAVPAAVQAGPARRPRAPRPTARARAALRSCAAPPRLAVHSRARLARLSQAVAESVDAPSAVPQVDVRRPARGRRRRSLASSMTEFLWRMAWAQGGVPAAMTSPGAAARMVRHRRVRCVAAWQASRCPRPPRCAEGA